MMHKKITRQQIEKIIRNMPDTRNQYVRMALDQLYLAFNDLGDSMKDVTTQHLMAANVFASLANVKVDIPHENMSGKVVVSPSDMLDPRTFVMCLEYLYDGNLETPLFDADKTINLNDEINCVCTIHNEGFTSTGRELLTFTGPGCASCNYDPSWDTDGMSLDTYVDKLSVLHGDKFSLTNLSNDVDIYPNTALLFRCNIHDKVFFRNAMHMIDLDKSSGCVVCILDHEELK